MNPTYFEISENGKIFVKRDSERLIETECPFPIADEFVSENFIRYIYDKSYVMYIDLFCYFPHLGGACWNTDALTELFNNPFIGFNEALGFISGAKALVEQYISAYKVVTHVIGGVDGLTKFYIHHLLESGECRISLLKNGKDEDFPISVLNGSISKDLFKNKYDSLLYSTFLVEVPGKGLFWNLSAIRHDFRTSPVDEDGISMAYYHLQTYVGIISKFLSNQIFKEVLGGGEKDLEDASDLEA